MAIRRAPPAALHILMPKNSPVTELIQEASSAGVRVHTIGYQLRTLDDLIIELKKACIDVVVDVRQTPWSNRRDFAKFRLEPALVAEGVQYVHAKFAGNPKELRRAAATHAECLAAYAEYLNNNPAIVQELGDLVASYQGVGRRVTLFCYERHPDDCHRSILASALDRRFPSGIEVLHLGADGAPRLIPVD